ncbi:hypothetical protein [Enterococcus sp. DIV0170]|uniref:hypothetical protein n=1 Tax=Enterococcus sp. DIV0170 TaxID=2774642 RepID=UPI003F209AAE
MKSNLTATQRVKLEKELNDIMLGAEKTDDQTTIKDRYKRAGEIMVQLNLLDPAHKTIPEIVARVYAQHTRRKIEKIVNATRD